MDNGSDQFLVVDDEADMCWALARVLRSVGAVCQTAPDAKQAIALAKRQPFRLAFLDAKLGTDDGLDLARWLHEVIPGIRIVIVSGYYYQDDPIITDAIRSGLISAFIAKPFARADILRAIAPVPGAMRQPPPAI